ncbi:MAG: hypothetical protein GYA34_01150 [Chloroflexi bacterium]|nr:hypothetical protein [Chloroflexota bacterium]
MNDVYETTQISEIRKPYLTPAIIHELELETKAGSPLGLPEPLDEQFPNP